MHITHTQGGGPGVGGANRLFQTLCKVSRHVPFLDCEDGDVSKDSSDQEDSDMETDKASLNSRASSKPLAAEG